MRMLASIVESSDDAIISKSLDGIIRSWNAAAERLFGYTAQQAVGQHISLVIPVERIDEEDQIIASLRAGRRVEHFETERVRSDGRIIAVSLTISPLKDASGTVIGASKIVRDITDRKRSEAELRKFAMLVENSTDFVGICDLQGVPTYINPTGLEMSGLADMTQATRTNVRDFFFPEDQRRIMEEFLPRVIQDGHAETEVRFRNFQTGQPRWMAYKVLTLTDATGQISGFATVSQDVTERKRLDDELRGM
ncbi:MAG: PAS domain-containing protein, partial [Terriglobia bacterium]